MDYNFNEFTTKEFEHLIQSLFYNILGYNTIIYGSGPDGGRELSFIGEADFPNPNEKWDGYWIIQAKFKERNFNKTDDFQWVKKMLIDEIEKFKNGYKLPDNYIFVTNAVLTPKNITGGRDKIEKIKIEYLWLIKNILIISYDDLCRILDNNRDIAQCFPSLLTTNDILSQILKSLKINDEDTIIKDKEIRRKYHSTNQTIDISKINICIDFGTSYSLASYCHNGKVIFISDCNNKIAIPSIITFFKNGFYVVGDNNFAHIQTDEIFTISNVKRYLGSKTVFKFNCYEYTPEEIAGLILKSIKQNAEEYFCQEINGVMISRPINYNSDQTHSLIKSYYNAGLNPIRMITESSSALLNIYEEVKNINIDLTNVIIIDLGGGTLDVAFCEYSDEVFEIIYAFGDSQLGGKDFDEAIYNYLIDFIEKTTKLPICNATKKIIRVESERIKKDLTDSNRTNIIIPDINNSDGNLFDLKIDFTRELFAQITNDLFKRFVSLIEELLSQPYTTGQIIDYVLISGQGSKLFIIKNYIQELFSSSKMIYDFQENAVANGLGLFVGNLYSKEEKRFLLLDVFTSSYAIKVNKFEKILMDSEKDLKDVTQQKSRIENIIISLENDRNSIEIELKDNKILANRNEILNFQKKKKKIMTDIALWKEKLSSVISIEKEANQRYPVIGSDNCDLCYIIESNTTIPTKKTETFIIDKSTNDHFLLEVVEVIPFIGENTVLKEKIYLNNITAVEVTIDIDSYNSSVIQLRNKANQDILFDSKINHVPNIRIR